MSGTGDGGARAWLLFDGDCGFCARMAAWTRSRDARGRLRIVPAREAPSPPMTPALQEACARALHIVTPQGRALRGGDAVIYTLDALGWRALARTLWRRPLRNMVDIGYRFVAERRKSGGCGLQTRPEPERLSIE